MFRAGANSRRKLYGATASLGETMRWSSAPSSLIPSGFSLTRADTGTYFDSAGLLQTAAINAARGTYRYNGSAWVFDGTMVEGASTNLALQSNSFNTTWGENSGVLTISQNATDPAGNPNSAWTMTDTGGTFNGRFQTFALTNGVTYCISVWIDKTGTPSNYPGLLAISGTHVSGICFNAQTGAATAITSYAGRTPITPVASGFTDETPTKYRAYYSFTANSTGNFDVVMLPAFNTDGTGVANIAASGSAVFSFFQLEVGSSPTSYTPTTTAAVARSADVLTASTSGLLANAQGFAAIKYRVVAAQSAQGAQISTFNGVSGGIPAYTFGGTVKAYDGTTVVTGPANTLTAGTVYSTASTWGGSAIAIAESGTVVSGLSFDGSMDLGATLRVGAHTDASTPLTMVLQSLRLGNTRSLTLNELGALTA